MISMILARGDSFAMPEERRKMSEILKEMSERLFRNPGAVPTPEAAQAALLFANVAWNESVGIDDARQGCRDVWKEIEADNPGLWNELKSEDVDSLIDELVRYKKDHYPDDRRRILMCGIVDGKVRVHWMKAAAPGVDSRWEMRLYGLVWTGRRNEAKRFLQETRRMSSSEAARRVATVAAELGLR
jgi:hypothetical protein